MAELELKKSLVVWWRLGREHGEGLGIRVNPPDVITEHLKKKTERFRQTGEENWRWWQVNDRLIVEKPEPDKALFGPDSRVYYLLERGISIIENLQLPPPDDQWKWYVHISDYSYHPEMDSWVMKDLFCDILVQADDHTYRILDLPDLAQALDIGLVTQAETSGILRRVDEVIGEIQKGEFPGKDVLVGREAIQKLG